MRSLGAQLAILRMRWARWQRQRAQARGQPPQATLPAAPSRQQQARLRISSAVVNGCEVWRVAPKAAGRAPLRLIYLHGGAYLRPINVHHWRFITGLVERTGCECVVPLYPLAPAHSGDTALQFVDTIWAREVLAETDALSATPLVLAGDSAGAGLALAQALRLRDRGLPLPARLLLISPWLDVEIPHPQAPTVAERDPLLLLAGLRRAGRLYAGRLDTGDPQISPARADPAGLPPVDVHVGGCELTGPDVVAWVGRARAAGVTVDLNLEPDMVHAWPLLGFAEGRAAQARIVAQLRQPLQVAAAPAATADAPSQPQAQAQAALRRRPG